MATQPTQKQLVLRRDGVLRAAIANVQGVSQATQRMAALLAPLAAKYPEVEILLQRFDWGIPGGIASLEALVSDHYLSMLAMRDEALVCQDFGWYCAATLGVVRDPPQALREVRWDLFYIDPAVIPLLRGDAHMRAVVFLVAACQPIPFAGVQAMYGMLDAEGLRAVLDTATQHKVLAQDAAGRYGVGAALPSAERSAIAVKVASAI